MQKRTVHEVIEFYKKEFPDDDFDFSNFAPYMEWEILGEKKNENDKIVLHVYLKTPDGNTIDLTEEK